MLRRNKRKNYQFSTRKKGMANYDTMTGVVSITLEELASAIASALKEVKVYVLESEISAAQNAVRAVVEQANIQER